MAAGAKVADPHDVAAAERIALGARARRGLSRAELRERLLRRGVAEPAIEALLQRCVERGWIDDGTLALDHALAAIRRGRGRDRVLSELHARGLGALAAGAWEQALAEHGGDAAALLEAAVAREVGTGRAGLTPRAYRRVYNALLRAGHDAEALRAALARPRDSPDDDEA
jgi:SOS response regulatory protein OraA/RecX